ncbi:cobalamin synthase [Richelia sinica FACHB-800]|uniref:Adenosylcobinamide-GDP ribazoletransferase n=1 Tax=Richelia sinica FACHB-800 TaxID=1357546 RepID=A0A975Y7K9_9NOST|nr:cobalamin synthase [Richelia sinica FACHB-800]
MSDNQTEKITEFAVQPFPWWKQQLLNFAASIIFYTIIPLPYFPGLDFQKVAYFTPIIGLMIGGILCALDIGMNYLGVPVLTRSVAVVLVWLWLTGGLHLDGAMDTADGLAVTDPKRRLEVMVDSATGAFGAMAAIAILLLKTTALTDISTNRDLAIIAACGWGRWGQQVAIAFYPYLKPTGKGAIHKQAIRTYRDLLPGWLLLVGWSGIVWWINGDNFSLAIGMVIIGSAIACIIPAWFHHQLGGHTGDTYGAVVEWSEALFLCILTIFH